MDLFRSRLQSIIMNTPTSASRGEKFSGLSMARNRLSLWMPVRLKSQAVRVVPMLAPKITLRVWEKCMMPELTRPTSMTVEAEDDCMAMVITAPSPRLMRGLAVIFFRVPSSLPPERRSRLWLMTCMPKRKNARPHSKLSTL